MIVKRRRQPTTTEVKFRFLIIKDSPKLQLTLIFFLLFFIALTHGNKRLDHQKKNLVFQVNNEIARYQQVRRIYC